MINIDMRVHDIGSLSPEQIEQRIGILNEQYEGARKEIVSLMAQNERIMQIGVLVGGGSLTYGIERKFDYLLLFLPFAFLALILVGLTRYELVYGLGGYKRYLEDELNAHLKTKLVFWEEVCDSGIHHSVSDNVLRFVMLAAFFLASYLGLQSAVSLYLEAEPVVLYLYICLWFAVMIGAAWGFRVYRGTFQRLYLASVEMRSRHLAMTVPPITAEKNAEVEVEPKG